MPKGKQKAKPPPTPTPVTRIPEKKAQKIIAVFIDGDHKPSASFSGFTSLAECIGTIDLYMTAEMLKALAMKAHTEKNGK
jgi:hypothetical protein